VPVATMAPENQNESAEQLRTRLAHGPSPHLNETAQQRPRLARAETRQLFQATSAFAPAIQGCGVDHDTRKTTRWRQWNGCNRRKHPLVSLNDKAHRCPREPLGEMIQRLISARECPAETGVAGFYKLCSLKIARAEGLLRSSVTSSWRRPGPKIIADRKHEGVRREWS